MKNVKKYTLALVFALSLPFVSFAATEAEIQESLINTLHALVLQLQVELQNQVAALTETEDNTSHSKLVGYANDGVPVYGQYGYKNASSTESKIVKLTDAWVIKAGYRTDGTGLYNGIYNSDHHFVQTEGDLDECNGRTAVTPEYPEGTYYYVMTSAYPYTPPCLKNSSKTFSLSETN